MEATAVNEREVAKAIPLPDPPTRPHLLARGCLGLVVCMAAGIGVYLIGSGWVNEDGMRAAIGCGVFGAALFSLIVDPWFDRLEALQRATREQLERLEGLAQQDPEVRLYLRRVYGLGRPILDADMQVVLKRKKKIQARAKELDRAERDRAIQERLQALVSTPDQSPRPVSTPGQEATEAFVDGLRKL
jgi:hypothetical protein